MKRNSETGYENLLLGNPPSDGDDACRMCVNDGKIPISDPMTFDGAVSERENGPLSTGQWSGGTRNGNAAYGEYELRVPLG